MWNRLFHHEISRCYPITLMKKVIRILFIKSRMIPPTTGTIRNKMQDIMANSRPPMTGAGMQKRSKNDTLYMAFQKGTQTAPHGGIVPPQAGI